MLKVITCFLLMVLSHSLFAFNGGWVYVVTVKDGDSIYVRPLENASQKPERSKSKPVAIRLASIDAPEYDFRCKRNQAFGKQSRDYLARLVDKKKIYIDVISTDRYGRYIGDLFESGRKASHFNAAMVKSGNAWVFRKYNKSKALLELESYAKNNKKGLWSSGDAVSPSVWRKAKKGCK